MEREHYQWFHCNGRWEYVDSKIRLYGTVTQNMQDPPELRYRARFANTELTWVEQPFCHETDAKEWVEHRVSARVYDEPPEEATEYHKNTHLYRWVYLDGRWEYSEKATGKLYGTITKNQLGPDTLPFMATVLNADLDWISRKTHDEVIAQHWVEKFVLAPVHRKPSTVEKLDQRFSDGPAVPGALQGGSFHYKRHPEFEPMKIIRAYELNFSMGCVIKYVLRAPFSQNPITDLKKAIWYLEEEILQRQKERDAKQATALSVDYPEGMVDEGVAEDDE